MPGAVCYRFLGNIALSFEIECLTLHLFVFTPDNAIYKKI